MQTSLLQFLKPLVFNKLNDIENITTKNNNKKYEIQNIIDNNINIKEDNKKQEDLISQNSENPFNNKIYDKKNEKNEDNNKNDNIEIPSMFKENKNTENKTKENFDNKNINSININNDKENNIKEKIDNVKEKESIILIDDDNKNENKKISDDYLFSQYIDSDDKELEIKNNNKIKRNIKIDLDKNNYFNFLIGGLINNCQVRKGIKGIIEQYEEKKDDIFKTQIIFERKPIIKNIIKMILE